MGSRYPIKSQAILSNPGFLRDLTSAIPRSEPSTGRLSPVRFLISLAVLMHLVASRACFSGSPVYECILLITTPGLIELSPSFCPLDSCFLCLRPSRNVCFAAVPASFEALSSEALSPSSPWPGPLHFWGSFFYETTYGSFFSPVSGFVCTKPKFSIYPPLLRASVGLMSTSFFPMCSCNPWAANDR